MSNFQRNKPSADENIVPDVPLMRSVQMARPSLPIRSVGFGSRKEDHATIDTSTAKRTEAPKWRVNGLPQLLDFYPLERTHQEINNASPQEVVDRILRYLKNHSIAAKPEKSSALLTTRDGVEFQINLFDNEGKIVVECQRLSGCSFSFCTTAKSMLKAAQGMEAMPTPKRTLPVPPLPQLPEAKKNETEALDLAFALLNEERLDAQALGMESLVTLTRCNNCTLEKGAQKSILEYCSSLTENNEFDEIRSCQHRSNALEVCANLLSRDALDVGLIKPDMLSILIRDLESAKGKPHTAHQAARCLVALCKSGMTAKLRSMGVPFAARTAHNEGLAAHALLEESAGMLKMEMGC